MVEKIIKTEKEFSNWFEKNYRKYGFSKVIRKNISTSPDFIMLKKGREIGVELETLASNFILHRHNIKKIDFVLCLVKDLELGIPVIKVKELIFQPRYRKITFSINDRVYNEFQKFCEENDIIISKRVERLMNRELEENKQKGRKK